MNAQLPKGGTPLGARHFKTQSAIPLSSLPATARMGHRIASGLTTTLREFADAPWRVTLDRTEDVSGNGSAQQAIRFETRQGSIPARLKADPSTVSALVEAAMGGSGSEEPYPLGDRPLSAIERELLSLAHGRLGRAAASAIEVELDRPVSVFNVEDASDDTSRDWVNFRFLVNVFGYSGELSLLAGKEELALQIKDASGSEADIRALEDGKRLLQREVAKAEVVFTACLAEEPFPLHEMLTLKPGSLLRLNATASGPVILSSGAVATFEGTLGRSGDHLALTLREATG